MEFLTAAPPEEPDKLKLLKAHLSWPTNGLSELPGVVRERFSNDEVDGAPLIPS